MKLPLAILIASPILGALGLMLWRCTVALHRNQLLRSLVWGATAMLWAIGWSVFADSLLLDSLRWL